MPALHGIAFRHPGYGRQGKWNRAWKRLAASGVIALRRDDGSNAQEIYRPYTAPGVYVPTVVPLAYDGLNNLPLGSSTSGSQFRPVPPPALDSEIWTRDVNEIRGSALATAPPGQQSRRMIGRFWLSGRALQFQSNHPASRIGQSTWMQSTALVSSPSPRSRRTTQSSPSLMQYHYNFWRPVMSHTQRGHHAEPEDAAESFWLPLGETPMHPEYPAPTASYRLAVSWYSGPSPATKSENYR